MRRLILIGALAVSVILGVGAFIVRNPFNLLVEKSDTFSFKTFETIESGTPISAAIDVLGDPVRVEPLGADYWQCPECSAYCFACNPPDWLIGYKEAWIYAGPEGSIRIKFINTQP